MNKALEEDFEKIISYIKDGAIYQEYLDLSQKMKENEKVNKLVNEVKKNQQQIVKLEYNKEDYSKLDAINKEKLDELQNIPLYQRFISVEQELNQMMQFVKEKIETYLDEITG